MEILNKRCSNTLRFQRLLYLTLMGALAAGMVYLILENSRLAKRNGQLEKSLACEPVAVFFLEVRDNDFKLKPVLYPVKTAEDKYRQALTILLGGPAPGSKLTGLFPKGSRVLSFRLHNGLATVNLNRRAAALNAGSTLEALAVAALVNTLTKFPEIYRVKILIEGKEIESLAGHVDLTTELHYSDHLVDPVPEKTE